MEDRRDGVGVVVEEGIVLVVWFMISGSCGWTLD